MHFMRILNIFLFMILLRLNFEYCVKKQEKYINKGSELYGNCFSKD